MDGWWRANVQVTSQLITFLPDAQTDWVVLDLT